MIYGTSRYAKLSLYRGQKAGKDITTIDVTSVPVKVSKSSVTHRVVEGDTLENIAFKYYGDATYWWVISDENDIFDIYNLTIGTLLNIP